MADLENAAKSLQPTYPIEIIKRPVKRNLPPVVQASKTFKGQQILLQEPLQKSLATQGNNGWFTAKEFGSPQNSAIYDPTKMRFVTTAKIQFYDSSVRTWDDLTIDNTSFKYLTGHRKNDKIYENSSSSTEIPASAKCARFSSPSLPSNSHDIDANELYRQIKYPPTRRLLQNMV